MKLYLEYLTRFEKEDGDLAQVEVDEVSGLVGDVRPEVPPNDAVPGGVVLLVKLLLDVGCQVTGLVTDSVPFPFCTIFYNQGSV